MNLRQLGFLLSALVCVVMVASAKTQGAAGTPSWPCTFNQPTVSSSIPTNPILIQDADADCFAWQEFIALNWQSQEGERGQPNSSKTAADFGTPSFTPTVWQTYKSNTEVFLHNAASPPAWNQPPPPPVCSNQLSSAEIRGRHVLTMVNSTTDEFNQESLEQAYPFSGPNWLADVNGNPVWYEMKLNEIEFNGVVTGLFYNADAQQCIATGGSYNAQTQTCTPASPTPQQVKLPNNSMELKAAWRQLKDSSQYARYLTTNAVIVQNGKCVSATMGLVGLHIIQKTHSQPNWIWATFEHVDNAPDNASASTAGSGFSFYSPSCKTQPVSTACAASGGSTTCAANKPPAYTLQKWFTSQACPPYPVQTTRITPVNSLVKQINSLSQQMIANANKQSVFQYYQLIDTVWTTSPNNPYAAGTQPSSPLPMPHMEPGYSVANTTMETFIQDFSSIPSNQPGSMCINCHRNASVAGNSQSGSDYSFLLGSATSPKSTKPVARSLLFFKNQK